MKRILLTVFFTLLAIANTNYAEAKEIEGEYEYFTQSKDITNLNTQLPAQKGLLEVIDDHKIRSTGSYQTVTKPPQRYLRINIEIEKESNKISIGYGIAPDNSRINHRIPIFQQIYKEDSANTHAYLILPQDVILTEEFQIIQTIDHEKEKIGYLYAVPPKNTQLSGLLRKINASMEGTYDLTKDEKSEMERTFDNIADAIGGKTGKGIQIIKGGIKWGIEKEESKRIEYLQKKYGDGYQIHKVPFHVPEGISISYSHIGRINFAFINTSKLTEPQKAFVEIPQLTYELTINGAMRKASIEGLAYEFEVEPSEPADNKALLYGEWEPLGNPEEEGKINTVIISKDHIQCRLDSYYKQEANGPASIVEENPGQYLIAYKETDGREANRKVELLSPNVIFFIDTLYKKVDAKKKTADLEKISNFLEHCDGDRLQFGPNDKSYSILETFKIDDLLIIDLCNSDGKPVGVAAFRFRGNEALLLMGRGEQVVFTRKTEK